MLLVVAGVVAAKGGTVNVGTAASTSQTTGTSAAQSLTSAPAIAPVARTFSADTLAYDNAAKPAGTQVQAAGTDITKQNERIQSDDTTYSQNAFGQGCTVGTTLSAYQSCLTQEEQTANSAESDVNSAQAAIKTDISQEQTAINSISSAIGTYIAQLDAVNWPTSQTRGIAATLEQDLTNERNVDAQLNTELSDGTAITSSKNQLATISSGVSTQLINMATALHIPPPATPSST